MDLPLHHGYRRGSEAAHWTIDLEHLRFRHAFDHDIGPLDNPPVF
jgi:hypothetical protein